MKRFICKSAIFLAGFFLISLAIQFMSVSAIRSIPIGDFGVLNSIDKGTINAEMIICGSSRGYDHYNPDILNAETGYSCYNISINGSRLEVQVPVLEWYLSKNRPPRVLIQNIDLFAGEFDPVIFQPYKFVPYLRNNALYQGLKALDQNWLLHRYVPCTNLIYFNKDMQKILMKDLYLSYKNKGDYLIKGYHPTSLKFPDEYEKDYFREHPNGIRYTLSQIYKDYLMKLIQLCRDRQIQLILVMSPEYEKLTPLEIDKQDIIDFYVRESQANGIRFLDFTGSEICRDKALFYNFTHMNADGADRFSRELGEELMKVLAER